MCLDFQNGITLNLGFANVIVLNGFEAIKEGMTKTEFLSRPLNNPFKLVMKESPFFISSTKIWQEHRKFISHAMRVLGANSPKVEDFIKEELHFFLEAIRKEKGQLIDLTDLMTSTMANNISALVLGRRFDYKSYEIKLIDRALKEIPKSVGSTSLILCFPFLKYIPFVMKFLDYQPSIKAMNTIIEFIRKQIEDHKKSLDCNDPRDLIDHYLVEMHSKEERNLPTTFTNEILPMFASEIFGAGSVTVKSSVLWSFYILAAFPEAQQRILNEIEDVIGQRQPSSKDLKLMPFTHSFMLEAWRWKTVVPLGTPRYAEEAATIGGHLVPKGSVIIANFWSVHHDPELWEDPEKFRPERFLSKDQKSVVKPNHLIIFSIGRRSCIGESMAHMEVFLYLVCTLQKFQIAMPEGVVPSFDAALGVTFQLEPHKLRMIPRSVPL